MDLTTEQKAAVDGSEKEFRTHLISDVQKMREEINLQPDRWHADTKKAMETLSTELKSSVTPIEEKMLALQKASLAIRNEHKMAEGDPWKKFMADPELRAGVNAIVRRGLSEAGQDGYFNAVHQKALGEDSGVGATLIRDGISKTVYDTLPGFGIWSTLDVEPMSSKNLALPVDTADPIAYVLEEGGVMSDDANQTGATVLLRAKMIAVLVNVYKTLIADAEFDISARVLMKMTRAIAKRMDYLAFLSDGTSGPINGGYTGAFNFFGTKTAAVATTIGAMTFEDITGTLLATDVQVLSRDAKWWMHPFVLINILSIKDGNGRPIFLTALEAPTVKGLGSILGFPVVLGNILPAVNSTGQKVAMFGDPNGYAVGLRQDIEMDFSDHAFWTANARSFRGIARAGFRGKVTTACTILKTA